jgi:hypothetical protein
MSMTTADQTRLRLDQAIDQLRVAGNDPRLVAVVAWAQSHDRALLKTIGVVYRNSADERLRLVARAANDFVDRDMRTPFYEAGPLQLNLAAGTYRIGDRVKALDYLTRAIDARPEWREHPIIIDFAALMMDVPPELAMTVLGTPQRQSAFNVAKGAGWWQDRALAMGHVTRRSVIRNLILYGIGFMLLAALTTHIAANAWLPQARLVRNAPSADLIASLVGPARWAFANLWPVAALIGLMASFDLLARGLVMHLAAVLVVDGKERSVLLFLNRLMVWQKVVEVLAVGALCAIFTFSALSLADTRNSTIAALEVSRTMLQLRIWAIASAVAYAVFVGRLLMDIYRFGIIRAAFVLALSTAAVTAAEAALTIGILSLLRR